jgi:hypothetical protein
MATPILRVLVDSEVCPVDSLSVCPQERPVKYAAKRTWPDKPKSWESKGDAESAEAFALSFADDQGLGLGTELVVMELGSEDPDLQFFKVASTSPYQLSQGEPRAGGGSTPQTAMPEPLATSSGADADPDAAVRPAMSMDHLRPFKSMIFYMLKVAFLAAAVIYALGMLFKYLRSVM